MTEYMLCLFWDVMAAIIFGLGVALIVYLGASFIALEFLAPQWWLLRAGFALGFVNALFSLWRRS